MSVLSSIDELYIYGMHTIDGAGGAHGTVHYHLHSHTGIANGHRVPRRRPPPNHITFYVRFNAIVDCEDRKTKLKVKLWSVRALFVNTARLRTSSVGFCRKAVHETSTQPA